MGFGQYLIAVGFYMVKEFQGWFWLVWSILTCPISPLLSLPTGSGVPTLLIQLQTLLQLFLP
jgi:hypothetical protein